MRELLLAEMKRAIEIMEKKPELERYELVKYPWNDNSYPVLDRELVELAQLLKLVRRHSVMIEKQIKEDTL
ncbi:hypothetical protein CN367_11810 [Priestia megaterium]|uniref:hypothetical protein n=1 Tax=Priestia megaterium TaxID=1404 RepID=UPI000BF93FCD|nr:hypothetical protein [Priestia megaterium]PEZ47045.1 hypothetical protein CN367_11810 [Priestia megaterium]